MTWSRRKAGSERALIIIVNSGRMRVSQVPGVVERDPGVYFIPPGSAEVVMTFESESNEIVFLSASSGLIADLLARGERASKQPAIGTHVLAPLYAFAANVCRIPIDSVSGSEPLKAVGAEVIRSIVRLVVGDGERVPQLYLGAMETIVSQYPNPAINAPEIARRFGISLRTLQLEFQGHGTTVSAEIRRVRTKAARRIKAANPKITPQELCDSVGFGSLSAMFRALRETTEE
ncbi:helix-turn-helix domain-containing protein [Humidisolicoccus flavus]|uniref:helix-turn-helix domain-containing protein n=1 Tax=Humidisolicoccus flavus TaxID=3111414 RepID=UPI0032437B63